MTKNKLLATKRIPGLLAYFAVPSVLSLLLHAFYNIVDRIFIGRGVGILGLSGVTLCFPIILLLFGVCMLFSSGSSSLVSIYLGKNQKEKAEKVIGNTISVVTVLGFIIAILGQFYYKNILGLFNIPVDALPYAEGYLRIILSGAPLFFYGFTLTFIIRAEGNPMYATMAIVVGTLINLILDPIFIFVLSMGVEGAALATIMSEAIVAIIGLLYMTRKKGVVHIRRPNLRLNFSVIKKITILGMSAGLMSIASSIQCFFLNDRLVVYGGSLAVAAMGIIFPISSVLRMFVFGMAAGMQPIIGYNYGAKQYKRVKEVFYYACKVSFFAILFLVAVILIFAEKIVAVFAGDNPQLISLGAHATRIFLFLLPVAAVNLLSSRYFQSIGKGGVVAIVGLSGQILIFIPVVFIFSYFYRLDGVWFSNPFTHLFTLGITILFITREIKLLPIDGHGK